MAMAPHWPWLTTPSSSSKERDVLSHRSDRICAGQNASLPYPLPVWGGGHQLCNEHEGSGGDRICGTPVVGVVVLEFIKLRRARVWDHYHILFASTWWREIEFPCSRHQERMLDMHVCHIRTATARVPRHQVEQCNAPVTRFSNFCSSFCRAGACNGSMQPCRACAFFARMNSWSSKSRSASRRGPWRLPWRLP